MRFLTFSKVLTGAILVFCATENMAAQDGNITVTQNPDFETLLNEKRKISTSITINDRYKIQVYNGESESAKKTLTDFRRDFKNYDATIVFSTPTYKVWAGNFKTRIEAERNLAEVKKKYPNAFLIKPNK